MSEIVFILGAGASQEAGAPVVRDFLDVADGLLRTGEVTESDWRADFELVARGRAALDAVYAKASIDSYRFSEAMVPLAAHLTGRKYWRA